MGRFSYLAGTSGTATIPAGSVVSRIRAIAPSGSGASFVVTPAGSSALPSVTLPAGAPWFELDLDVSLDELGPTTTIAFTGTASYVVFTENTGGV